MAFRQFLKIPSGLVDRPFLNLLLMFTAGKRGYDPTSWGAAVTAAAIIQKGERRCDGISMS
jgi:hypothetical protein